MSVAVLVRFTPFWIAYKYVAIIFVISANVVHALF